MYVDDSKWTFKNKMKLVFNVNSLLWKKIETKKITPLVQFTYMV